MLYLDADDMQFYLRWYRRSCGIMAFLLAMQIM